MNQDRLQKKLELIKIKNLSDDEQQIMWQFIQTRIRTTKSPFLSLLLLTHKNMIKIIAAIVILAVSSFGVVKAADNAKPGDFLFPLDRAIEDIQIKITPKKKKDELKIKFALERVEEVSILLKNAGQDTQNTPTPLTATSTPPTNTTSTPTSKNTLPSDNKINRAIQVAINYIEKVKNEMEQKGNSQASTALEDIIESLKNGQDNIGSLELEIEKEGDKNKLKLEIKGHNKQNIEIESENGKIEIKSKDHKYDDISEEDDRFIMPLPVNSTSTSTTTSDIIFEKVEVKLYQNLSKVEMKTNKGEFKFTLDTADLNKIKDYIKSKHDIPNLDNIIKIEFEEEKKFKYKDEDNNHDSIYIPVNPSYTTTTTTSTQTSGSSSSQDQTSQNHLKEAEAEVKNGYTKIKIKTYNQEYEFSLNTTDKDEVIQYISTIYNIPLEEVNLKIKFKYKNKNKGDEEEDKNKNFHREVE